MMFKSSLSYRFRLLSCMAGCFVALSAAHAADKKPEAHKHHAHAGAGHDAAGKKKAATKKAAGKTAEAQKKAAAKHLKHDDSASAAHAAKAQHTAAHHKADKHRAAKAALAGAGTAAAVGAGAAAATPAADAAGAQPPVPPPSLEDQSKGAVTGLPLPRYASLRADEVNLRAGPGRRFPILWVYHRRGMPVRIEREFDVWRLVEDATGQKGWVQQATASGGRDFMVPGEPAGDEAPLVEKTDQNGAKVASSGHMDSRVLGTVASAAEAKDLPGSVLMHNASNDQSPVVAILKPGTIGSVKECAAGSDWCRVSVKQYSGWVQRHAIWGVDAEEVIAPS